MKTYVLNTPVLTQYGEWHYEGPLDKPEVRDLLSCGFVSAVGHQSSADFMTQLLEIEIPMNRIQISMNKNDQAVILSLKTRLPETIVLDKEQIEDLPFEFGLLKRLK